MTEDEFRNGGIAAPNAVEAFDYMAECDKTCSIVWKPEYVDATMFNRLLESVINTAEQMNLIKKLFFRGKTPTDVGLNKPFEEDGLSRLKEANEAEISIIHGIVGIITEAGELAEVLQAFLKTSEFDKVNLIEECGDVAWYQTRVLRGIGASVEMMERANIEKLHGRHGNAFDVFRDANRDLAQERTKLERSAQPLFDEPKLGLATNTEIKAEIDARESLGHTHPDYKTSGYDGPLEAEGPSLYGDCIGTEAHRPPEAGLTWVDGCWRKQIVRDIPGLAV
jgi:NTP pyrophosphatase (non-canonical NTP hydrolase)